MKKLLYLPLLALILLTGCKGNSFMNQRYTKLGHGTKQKTKEEVVLSKKHKQTPPVSAEITKRTENNDVFVSSVFLKENVAVPRSGFSILKSKSMIESVFIKSYSKNTLRIKSEAKQFKAKKTFAGKSASARGVASGALNIFLSIIILWAVIALVIFLITLIV